MNASYPDINGRGVFITGGAAGIGASMVRAFAGQGARVAFVDIDEQAGVALAAETGAGFYQCDVCDIEKLTAIFEQVSEQNGPIGVLVNNAANDHRHAVEDVTPDYWRNRMQTNLDHAFFMSQAVQSQMRGAGGGAIINFGSLNWLTGGSGMIAYQTAKAAVHGLTKGLAQEFGADNIRVNCILPGWVMTERQKTQYYDKAGEQMLKERQPLPGHVQPEDVAGMAVFLASDSARMCTGQFFVVDGGLY